MVFVSSYKVFSNLLSELLYGELDQFNVTLADHIVSDYVGSTTESLFYLSSEYDKYHNLPVDYVLTTTWFKTKKGIEVNARIIGLYNKKVIASANRLTPKFLLSENYQY